MSHIAIGQFQSSEDLNFNIFLDDVSIVKIPKNDSTFSNIQFKKGSAKLLNSSVNILNLLINHLFINDTAKVEIKAHTDSDGSIEYNFRLSEKRLKSVSDYLIRNSISSDRIIIKSFGETQLLNTEKTEREKLKNRRVEIKIVTQ